MQHRIIVYYPDKEWLDKARKYYKELIGSSATRTTERRIESDQYSVRFVHKVMDMFGLRCDYYVILGGVANCPSEIKQLLVSAVTANKLRRTNESL